MSGVVRRIVQAATAPKAVGPYSHAVIADKTMYISGQLGLDPSTTEMVKGGVVAETHQALKNLGSILNEAGVGYDNVVKTTVLLANISDFSAVNGVYETYFTKNHPARACYQVAALPKGALVEIEAVAIVGPIIDQKGNL